MASDMYNADFYRLQKDKSYESAKTVLPFLLEKIPVSSCVDFGCGAGTWLRAALDVLGGGTRVFGLDFGDNTASLMIPKDCFLRQDLSVPIDLGEKFDLVISLEVAEHLPKESAATFVESLCRHGDVVLFSAAIPGQGGTGHVNEQWQSYWAAIFQAHGFRAVDILRPKFWNHDALPVWYRQNMMLYVSERYDSLDDLLDGRQESPMDMIHPDLWKKRAVSMLVPSLFQQVAAIREFVLRHR